MRMPLRFRFFLWLLFLLFLFIAIQAVVFTAVEVLTWRGVELDGALESHLMEVVIGVGMDFIALPVLLAVAWWISHKMVDPVKTIAATARRISAGALNERIPTETLSADEMRELGAAINEAFDRYHNAMERLTRFSGDASHQLRTPLAAIRAGGEVALNHERSPAEYRETIGAMLEDLDRLTKIVDQLLMLARLDNAGVTRSFQPTDLSDIINRTVEFLRPVLDENNIALILDLKPVPPISGNADLLIELLSNLLDNAARHTPPRGTIIIGLAVTADRKIATLSVNDSGSGISEGLAQEIFQRFSRDPEQTSGSGLGLAIVADIAQVHGGHATLVPTPTPGACFHIEFPTHATAPQA
jgi:signal transduction histidine kinase